MYLSWITTALAHRRRNDGNLLCGPMNEGAPLDA